MNTRQTGPVKGSNGKLKKSSNVRFRVTDRVLATIDAYAARRGLKSAQICREALGEYLRKHRLPKRKEFLSLD